MLCDGWVQVFAWVISLVFTVLSPCHKYLPCSSFLSFLQVVPCHLLPLSDSFPVVLLPVWIIQQQDCGDKALSQHRLIPRGSGTPQQENLSSLSSDTGDTDWPQRHTKVPWKPAYKKLQLTTVRFSTNKHHPEIPISTVGAEDAAVNTSVATVYLAKRSASWKAVAIATTELRALIFLGFGRWFSCSAAQQPGGGAQALLVYVNGCTGLMLNTRLEVCWVQWT